MDTWGIQSGMGIIPVETSPNAYESITSLIEKAAKHAPTAASALRHQHSARRRDRGGSRPTSKFTRMWPPLRKVWARARNVAAAIAYPARSPASGIRRPMIRPMTCDSVRRAMKTMKIAARAAPAA